MIGTHPHRVLLVLGLVCFVLAALWPALPPSMQRLRVNLTALGLALVTLAELAGG